MNFLERPSSGRVLFDGKDLSALSEKEMYAIRRSIGMIFQQFNLLKQRTALENICFPLEIAHTEKSAAKKRALELLEIVELADKANAYPSELSGGQQQRVAIARALATKPKVLLCDEATSALDPATTRSILKLLKDINRQFGITVVIITHEMRVVEEICTAVAIIDDSRIAETGSVKEVFSHPKSAAAKRLFYSAGSAGIGKRSIRIVFDGQSSFEPIVADMVLRFKAPVNIIHADTRDINGLSYGQMLLQLPGDNTAANAMIEHLLERGLSVEEVNGNV
jgi:D-methionine transport system ATP-binding protein